MFFCQQTKLSAMAISAGATQKELNSCPAAVTTRTQSPLFCSRFTSPKHNSGNWDRTFYYVGPPRVSEIRKTSLKTPEFCETINFVVLLALRMI